MSLQMYRSYRHCQMCVGELLLLVDWNFQHIWHFTRSHNCFGIIHNSIDGRFVGVQVNCASFLCCSFDMLCGGGKLWNRLFVSRYICVMKLDNGTRYRWHDRQKRESSDMRGRLLTDTLIFHLLIAMKVFVFRLQLAANFQFYSLDDGQASSVAREKKSECNLQKQVRPEWQMNFHYANFHNILPMSSLKILCHATRHDSKISKKLPTKMSTVGSKFAWLINPFSSSPFLRSFFTLTLSTWHLWRDSDFSYLHFLEISLHTRFLLHMTSRLLLLSSSLFIRLGKDCLYCVSHNNIQHLSYRFSYWRRRKSAVVSSESTVDFN